MTPDLTPMRLALEEAIAAAHRGEVPVGAVVTGPDGAVIAQAGNETRAGTDPTAHAEMLAIRRAAAILGAERLSECNLYVTLEPCAMCAGAIAHARIKTLIYGAFDPKGGGVDHGARFFAQPTCLHKPRIVAGVDATECATILRDFFSARR